MSSQRDQQKEVVRLLVMQHGLQKASELSGVDYDLVRQWESRRKRRAIKQAQAAGVTMSQSAVTVAADNYASEIKANERETRLSLSKYARKAAKDSESASLRDSPFVHKAAKVAGIAFRWNEDQGKGNFTLNVLNMGSLDVSVSE